MDAPRTLLVATLARRPDLDLESLSHAIGRNRAYLRQYVMRGAPRELPEPAGGAPHGTALPGPPQPADRPDDLPVYSAR